MKWQNFKTAPKDGTWFLVILPTTFESYNKGYMANPDLYIIRWAACSKKNVPGYWDSISGRGLCLGNRIWRAIWAPLDALPLADLYRAAYPGIKLLEPLKV